MSPLKRPLILLWEQPGSIPSSTPGYLTEAGYEVREVGSASVLQAWMNSVTPADLVILAWPEFPPDAAEVRELLADPDHQGRPPLLMLVPGATRVQDQAAALGADDLLPLSVDPPRLLARVRALLAGHQRCTRMEADLHRLAQIGIDLSAERDLKRLLGKIVAEARTINNADAGSLYIVDHEAGALRFEVAQNESLGLRLGAEDNLPPVALEPWNVSAYVALTGEVVNIPDVYQAEGFDFSGPRDYDALTGYRCRSMLVVPVSNHAGEIIAVLQLINAQEPGTKKVVSFSSRHVERTRSLASHAGVALTNVRLYSDLQTLLEGMIHSLADAVDEKSAYTAGHVRRVTEFALSLATAVNRCGEGRFGEVAFTADELEELRVAGLLHDIGKIVIPEHVVDKATKLQGIYDRMAEIRVRFSLIRRGLEVETLLRILELTRNGASAAEVQSLEADLRARIGDLADDLEFLERTNAGGEGMSDAQLDRLKRIATQRYRDDDGVFRPYLTDNELRNLSIRRGTLLPEELEIIRSHAAVSHRILRRIPFPRNLQDVPVIAADHHEALDGTGYPAGKTAEQLPLPSRILAVADIFDALTASDRPYKRAFSLETAYRILRENAARGKLDAQLVELFIQAGCHTATQSQAGAVDASLGGTHRPDLERIG